MRRVILVAGVTGAGLFCGPLACAGAPPQGQGEQLTPDQLEAVRRGPTASHVPDVGTTVPLLGPPELPLIEVRLNGHGPYRFLVDLGSNVVILRRDVADEAGLEIVLDRDRSDIVVADLLTIGDASFEDVWLGAYDELDVDGVIGYNLLMGSGIVIDYPARTFRVGPVDLPEPDGVETLAYEVRSRLPYVRALVGGREMLLNFDTGAANHLVFPLFMADSLTLESTPEPGPSLHNNQTGTSRNLIARLAGDIRFGSHVIERPVMFFDEDVEDAWLGSAILLTSRLEFDTERQVMRLTSRVPLDSPAYRTLGIGLGPLNEGTGTRTVAEIIPGMPAESGPIASGDSVVSIGGVPAERLDSYELRKLAAENDMLELNFIRDGRTHTQNLKVGVIPAG